MRRCDQTYFGTDQACRHHQRPGYPITLSRECKQFLARRPGVEPGKVRFVASPAHPVPGARFPRRSGHFGFQPYWSIQPYYPLARTKPLRKIGQSPEIRTPNHSAPNRELYPIELATVRPFLQPGGSVSLFIILSRRYRI